MILYSKYANYSVLRESRTIDEDGNELYIDIELTREQVDSIISDLVDETISITRNTLGK